MKQTIVTFFILCLVIPTFVFGQDCGTQSFTIDNDTVVECGQEITIHAQEGMVGYEWNTGETTSSIVVNQAGTYSCEAFIVGGNLVENGDFSQGEQSFNTDYEVGSGGSWGQLSDEGTYAVSSSLSLVHNNFPVCYDHTEGNSSGNMLIVNGASYPDWLVWSQTITVEQNTDYQFKLYGMSASSQNPANLVFKIDGEEIGNGLNLPTTTCEWEEYFEIWNSGNATEIEIAIINTNSEADGNDFAIDDISFRPVCYYEDEMVLDMPEKPEIIIDSLENVCEGDELTLVANSPNQGMEYNWNNGEYEGNEISINPVENEILTVFGIDENGCESDEYQVEIQIHPYPEISISGDTEICENSEVVLAAESSVEQTTFNWIGYDNQSDTLIDEPSGVDSVVYVVEGETDKGCKSSDSVTVTILDLLVVEITGNPIICDEDQYILYAESNLDNTSFTWTPEVYHASVLPIDASDEGMIYLTGNHPICGEAKDSVEVQLGETPLVIPPDNDTICLGDEITVSASSSIEDATITWHPDSLIGETQTFSPLETEEFFVQANSNGCISDMESFIIEVNPGCETGEIVVPNVFTPNGDGINDYFHLKEYQGVEKLDCVILNRWGNVVREFNTPDFKWDGTDAKGNSFHDGTYFYKINAIFVGGSEVHEYGEIQLFN